MAEFKLSRNGSGYYDETAYKAIYDLAKPGDIFEYTMPKCKKIYLIIKNHGKFSTALALLNTAEDGDYEIASVSGNRYFTDPRMIQYIYNDNCGKFMSTVSLVDFANLRKEIGAALSIDLERKTQIPQAERKSEIVEQKEEVNHPNHYQGAHECIEEMAALFGVEAVKHFCMCNVHKYRYRASQKNGQTDLKKADWYMAYLMKLQKGEEAK